MLLKSGQSTPKIFNIGLSRTGTKSFIKAMTILGVKAKHLPDKQTLLTGNYDCYADIPCYAYHQSLLKLYPNSKVIATIRSLDSWLHSCQIHFTPTDNPYFMELRNLVYGSPVYDKTLWTKAYNQHIEYINDNSIATISLEDSAIQKWSTILTLLNPHYPHHR